MIGRIRRQTDEVIRNRSAPWPLWLAGLVAAVLALGACSGDRPVLTTDRIPDTTAVPPTVARPTPTTDPATQATTPAPASATTEGETAGATAEQLVVAVLESYPHDPAAFTQGLELHDGTFIESTGLRFESSLRRVIPVTGEVTQIVDTPSDYFAEGVTRVGDELIQLTWTEGTAFYWDAATFELNKQVTYSGEGWGLCYDGSRLVMSDGSADLIVRDPVSFEETGRVPVTYEGRPVTNLNELECVDDVVWANVWQTDLIVRIDPITGIVTGIVDGAALERPPGADVLNGIAWDETTQSFWITGKLWPNMYRVSFVPVGE